MTYRALAFTSLPLMMALAAAACGGTVVQGGAGGAPTGDASSSSSGIHVPPGTTSSSTSTSSSTGSVSSSSSGGHVEPPPPPSKSDSVGGTNAVFAVTRLYLGDTDRDGTPDKVGGWKQYGFDLDGKISTSFSTDLCQPRLNGSPHTLYPDGNGGIDNSFGKNILPILLGIDASVSIVVNDTFGSGKYTLLFDLAQLGPGVDAQSLPGRAYGGADLGHPPLLDGSDAWPVDPTSLSSPPFLASALAQFPMGYLTQNTWVGFGVGDLVVRLDAGGAKIPLTIRNAVVDMTLDPMHFTATNGNIAGIIPVDLLKQALKNAAGTFDASLCAGPTLDSILAQVEMAADILQDGTQDPTKLCDGISIGLGFDASRVQVGPVAPSTPPPPDPCSLPDGGA